MPHTFVGLDDYRKLLREGKVPTGAAIRKSLVPDSAEPIADTRRVRFIVSSGAVDRDNDTVNQAGWDFSAYEKNPVVLWAHDYSSLPIGKAVKLERIGGKTVSEVEFADHPFADTVYRLVQGGFLNATSVGFRPTKVMHNEQRGGLDFETQELLEYSIVPVPANPEALIEARAAGIDVAPLLAWAQGVTKAFGAEQKVVIEIDGQAMAGAVVPHVAKVIAAQPTLLDVLDGDTDPVRWNRQLSKAFDVDGEPVEPSAKLYGWVSRFLSVPVKDLYETSLIIGGAKMGARLVGLDEQVAAYKTETVRNLHGGSEAPPVYETIQLNSQKSQDFLVEGTRFLSPKDADTSAKWVLRAAPSWGGIVVTAYCASAAKDEILSVFVRAHRRAQELNYLKGEAFTLSGEFLDREPASFDDVYLDAKLREPIERTVKLLQDQGKGMDSRGLIFMGPPGTGKTLVARTIMHQCPDATFVWASSRDFGRTGMFYGVELAYELAKENAPTVVFMDDIDSWWTSSTVDLLKTTLDGLAQNKGIVTILATNHPESLPEALIDRPGRFHDVLLFALPDEPIRRTMLTKWAPSAQASTLATIARDTDGYSGAHLRDLVRYADTMRAQDQITIDEALARSLAKVKEQRATIEAARSQRRYRTMKTLKTVFTPDYRQKARSSLTQGSSAGVQVLHVKDGQGTCDRCEKDGALRVGVCEDCFEALNAWTHEAGLAATAALSEKAEIDDLVVRVKAIVEKRGRVLSSANEGRIRRAKDLIEEVLQQLAAEPIEDPAVDPPTPVKADPCPHGGDPASCAQCAAKATDVIVLEIVETDAQTLALRMADDDEEFDVDPEDLKAAIIATVRSELGGVIQQATAAALNRARGRLD